MNAEILEKLIKIQKELNSFLKEKIKEEKIPIKLRHVELFKILNKTKNKIEFKVLVKEWGISKSTLSEVINRYTALNIIEKESSDTDKRLAYIYLTELGRRYSKDLLKIEEEFILELLKPLDATERKLFDNILEKIID